MTAQVSSSCSCTNAQGSTNHSTNKKSAGSLQRKNSRRHMNIVIIRGAQACRRRLRKKEEEREQTQKKEVEEHTHARTHVRTHAHWKKGGKRCSCLFFLGEREGGREGRRQSESVWSVAVLSFFFSSLFPLVPFLLLFFFVVCAAVAARHVSPLLLSFFFFVSVCVWCGWVGVGAFETSHVRKYAHMYVGELHPPWCERCTARCAQTQTPRQHEHQRQPVTQKTTEANKTHVITKNRSRRKRGRRAGGGGRGSDTRRGRRVCSSRLPPPLHCTAPFFLLVQSHFVLALALALPCKVFFGRFFVEKERGKKEGLFL